MALKLAVFDMAGTTVSDNNDVAQAFQKHFLTNDLSVTKAEINPLMGYHKPTAIQMILQQKGIAFDESLVTEIHDSFVNEMLDFYEYDSAVRPMEGAEDLSFFLKEHGVLIALNTGFSREIAATIIGRFQWLERGLIDDFIGSDEVPEGRPFPYMIAELKDRLCINEDDIVMKVGDTIVDIEEGKNAGCDYIISVTTGTASRKQLEEWNPTHIVDSLSQIPAILNEPFPFMRKYSEWFSLAMAGLSAFCVYTCMYAFRKPFTAANFDGESFLSIDYKIWLVVAQTIGYTLSKFYGIFFIAELRIKSRSGTILLFIVLAWISLLLFAIIPAPYNIIFLLLNGFPLGIIYGLVFSYLEGRRSTELLGAVLATSFIFASGFTQSVGKYVLLHWNVNEWWMPFITGFVFIVPTIIFTWLLGKTPAPTKEDVALRTERLPMNKADRKGFVKAFLPGLILLITTYVMLTIIRDYRSNFASNIWAESGVNDASVFTRSELPASLFTLVLMGLLIFIKKNIYALLINHIIIIAGFMLCIFFTFLYIKGATSPFWWMTTVGVGLYMGYVPFNCMLFDRLIASFKFISNAGFIIYLADSFGYLGSNVILITKNFLKLEISWSDFFIKLLLSMSVLGIILTLISALYFRNKYYKTKTANPV